MVSKPRGMTLMSFVIVLVVLGFFALIIMKLFLMRCCNSRNSSSRVSASAALASRSATARRLARCIQLTSRISVVVMKA